MYEKMRSLYLIKYELLIKCMCNAVTNMEWLVGDVLNQKPDN